MYLQTENRWKYLPLESVLDYYIGGDWGKDEDYNDEEYCLVQCIRGAEYKKWQNEKGKTASLRKIKVKSLTNRKLREGDILVEISGGGPDQPVGRTALIDVAVLSHNNHIPKVCSNFLRLIRPSHIILPEFLNLYLKLFYASGEIIKYQAGSNNLRNLKFNDYLQISIPIPPIDEQQLIISKIEELFSELDKGIEELNRAKQELKVYRQSVLRWAFEGRLTSDDVKEGELPQGWKLSTLGEFIGNIEAGKSFKCNERPPKKDEVGVLKVSAVTWGIFDEQESKTVTDISKINPRYYVNENDFLFSRANTIELVGNAVIVKAVSKKLMLSDKTLRINFDKKINKFYALYYLRSRKGRVEIERLATGNQASMRNIGQDCIRKIAIPIPNLVKDQEKIVQEIESRLSVADKLEETITQSLKQAEALRQSILKKAFEGRLIKLVEKKPYKPRNEYFYQAQVLGFINKYSKDKGIGHGEMTIAKYAYLADKVYGVPTFYDYKRWHLGPYPPEMKKAIKNSKYFVQKKGYLELTDEQTLLKYNNPYKDQIQAAVGDLTSIFSKYQGDERSDKTELLATICKVIEDTKSTDLVIIRQSMREWPIELPGSIFKNKADKFSEADTKNCLKFVLDRGWDKKILEVH